jgi:alpha-tubulin suppressor-like RCC1 family protein
MKRLMRIFVVTLVAALLWAPAAQAAFTTTPDVQAGAAHSIALKYDGTVWTWGSNAYGQLGNGLTTDSDTPVQVKNLANVIAIAAGYYHNLALKSDGTVWAWGQNTFGQLGNNTVANSNVPVQVLLSAGPPVVNVTSAFAIAAGSAHSLIAAGANLFAMGLNVSGQLGDGTNTNRSVATSIAVVIPRVSAVAAGRLHSVALYNGGLVATWGDNAQGQLGDGTFTNNNTPFGQVQPAPYTQISSRNDGTIALDANGLVYAWGPNDFGQIGVGAITGPINFAVQSNQPGFCPGYAFVVNSVSSGGTSNMAIASDGTILGWGDSTAGQLSNIPPTSNTCATGLPDVAGAIKLAGGVSHTLAYRPDGTVMAFGSNGTGQLGDGTTTNRLVPVSVLGASGVGVLNLLGLSNFTVVIAGGGTVTSSPAGLTCSSGTCVVPFPAGTAVTLTATAGPGNIFQGWGGGCTGTSACALTIASGQSVTASFSGTSGGSGPVSGTIPDTGWWWNPGEPGRGFMIEQRNGKIFMATFLYEFSGRASWYGSGPTAYDNGNYTGVLNLYGSGQTLTGPYKPATLIGGTFGSISINFSSNNTGSITWPEGTIPIQRFDIISGGSSLTPLSGTPQAGWWWNPNEAGRGFSLEIQGGTMLIAGYMYDTNGNPIWYSSTGAMANASTYQGNWIQYGYGQTLTGAYQPASVVNSNVGSLTLQFSSPTNGTMTLPDGRQIPITRYSF